MKQIILKLCLYGTLSTIYATACVFGALYPQFGVPEKAIVYEEQDEIKQDTAKKDAVKKDAVNNTGISDDKAEIHYKSYFVEKIKSLKKNP